MVHAAHKRSQVQECPAHSYSQQYCTRNLRITQPEALYWDGNGFNVSETEACFHCAIRNSGKITTPHMTLCEAICITGDVRHLCLLLAFG
eukprot:164360-Amphidinium_carterae.1